MGRGVGAYCEACGWDRQFIFGRGILSSCKDECLESLKSGEFGNLAQRMADELASDEIKLQSELTTFKCAHCGELVSGEFMTAQHAGTHEMPVVFISCEDVCPACGQPMAWVRGIPIEGDAVEYLRKMRKKGCPKCGGELKGSTIIWD